eukprot:jgi/Bigna1/136349/aug1.33_g11057
MLGQPPPTSNTRSRRARSQQPVDTSTLTDEEYLAYKERLENFQETLSRMGQHPGNKRCADCREHNPRYIDVQWGVYLCLLCSGAHQKVLGTTIVTIDTTEVDDQWITTLEQRGNSKVNDDLEDKLETIEKRKMSWSITNRSKFVTKKYVEGKWMKKEGAKIDLKDPSHVVSPPEDANDGRKKKKKKDKKRKKKDKKKNKEESNAVQIMPPQEEVKGQSSAPSKTEVKQSDGGLTNLFDILSMDGGSDSKAAPKPASVPSQPPQSDAKKIIDENTTNDIMAMFENPAPQQQTGYGAYGAQPRYGYGVQPATYANPSSHQAQNPFAMSQQASSGNPFAQASSGYAQPNFGYAAQPMNQNQMRQMPQQNSAFHQQQQVQQQQNQQQNTDIMNFF